MVRSPQSQFLRRKIVYRICEIELLSSVHTFTLQWNVLACQSVDNAQTFGNYSVLTPAKHLVWFKLFASVNGISFWSVLSVASTRVFHQIVIAFVGYRPYTRGNHECWDFETAFINSVYELHHTRTHLTALFPGLPGWAGTRKVKPIWILLKQETVSGSGISWAICKSASRSRQPCGEHPTTQVLYKSDALPAAQPTASTSCKFYCLILLHLSGCMKRQSSHRLHRSCIGYAMFGVSMWNWQSMYHKFVCVRYFNNSSFKSNFFALLMFVYYITLMNGDTLQLGR